MRDKNRISSSISEGGFVIDLADGLNTFLCMEGIDEKKAESVSLRMVEFVCKTWGGAQPYIPKTLHKAFSSDHRQIFDSYQSGNKTLRDLAIEFGKTERHIRSVLEAERLRRREERKAEMEAHREKEKQRWRRETLKPTGHY